MSDETTMTKQTFMMDPECEFQFTKVPNDLPKRFFAEIHARLWAYWLANCRGRVPEAELAAVRDAITARRGWCSVADMRDAGYTEYDQRMVPSEVVEATIREVINAEPWA